MNCFVVWLNDEMHLVLFLARSIARDPHHCKSLTRYEPDLSLKNFSSGLVERSYAVAITTKPQQLIDNSFFILDEYVFEKELWHTSKIILQI